MHNFISTMGQPLHGLHRGARLHTKGKSSEKRIFSTKVASSFFGTAAVFLYASQCAFSSALTTSEWLQIRARRIRLCARVRGTVDSSAG